MVRPFAFILARSLRALGLAHNPATDSSHNTVTGALCARLFDE
jgi:hypothetical protein